jgi:hypothetical protein
MQEDRPPPLAETPDILKFINDIKTVLIENIKLADDKAKAVFAISAAFLVYLFNGAGWPNFNSLLVVCDLSQITRLAFLCLSMLALLASSVHSLLVAIPRMGTAFRGIVFFGSIAKWGSASEYADTVLQSDILDLRRESAMHNYELSGVAVKKFRARCLILMAVGVALALAYIGLSWNFTRNDADAHSPAGVVTGASPSSR